MITHTLESLPELLGPRDLSMLYQALQFSPPSGYQYRANDGEALAQHIVMILVKRERDRAEAEATTTVIPETGNREWTECKCHSEQDVPLAARGKMVNVQIKGDALTAVRSGRDTDINWSIVTRWRLAE